VAVATVPNFLFPAQPKPTANAELNYLCLVTVQNAPETVRAQRRSALKMVADCLCQASGLRLRFEGYRMSHAPAVEDEETAISRIG